MGLGCVCPWDCAGKSVTVFLSRLRCCVCRCSVVLVSAMCEERGLDLPLVLTLFGGEAVEPRVVRADPTLPPAACFPNPQQIAGDVAAALAHIGATRAVVVGHSFGTCCVSYCLRRLRANAVKENRRPAPAGQCFTIAAQISAG